MSDGLLATSKRSNYMSIMLYLCHEMDIDYLVLDELINIMAKTCLKVHKVNCSRLRKSLSLETFACL
jgi:hypothetical protein